MESPQNLPPLKPLYRPELSEDEHCTEAARQLEAAHDALIRAARHLDATATRSIHFQAFKATVEVDQCRSMLAQREQARDLIGSVR